MTEAERINSSMFLDGIRVLDFTQYLAGPSSTRLMAELGAEIIKVEQPPYGDPMRAQSPRKNRRSGSFVQQNRGKQSICVDLRSEAGADFIRQLIPTIDVVVENFTPGVMARRGLDYDTLRGNRPDLIMASVSGFGQDGPLADRSSFDFIAQAYSGIMHVTGEPDGPPVFVGAGLGDTIAGVHAFAGIGHALFRRERTGRGAYIDVSMVDALFHVHENNVQAHSITNGEYEPMREGRHYGPVAPAGSFQGPEGWIVMLCGVNQIESLWPALGRPELADDPRFATNETRVEHRDALTEIIEAWMATFDSDEAVLAALAEHRVPSGPVLSPADAINHAYFVERGVVREISDRLIGNFAVPGFPIAFDGTRPNLDAPASYLGEHNEQVAGSIGFSKDQVARMVDDGVLFSKPR